jgi:hypothetical protein
VKRRLYPFTNVNNELCSLKKNDKDGDEKLIGRLEEEYKEVKTKFN